MAIFSDSMFQANMGTQFETPHEAMHMAGGGWATNAAYMSPSYMANFRPEYGGPVGFGPNNIPSFSTFGAIGAASTFGSSPYYVNPLAYRNAAIDQLATAPADAAMWGMQNIAAPLAAITAGSMVSGMRMPGFAPITGAQRFAGGMTAAAAMAPRMGSAWWRTNVSGTMSQDQFSRYRAAAMRAGQASAGRQSFGAFSGATIGRGMGAVGGYLGGAATGGAVGFGGRLLGMNTSVLGTASSFAGTAGRGLSMAGGAVGAAAGSLLMPFMLASGAMDAANSAVFDPYIAVRRGQQAATAGFANEYTGTSPFGTLGLGRTRSAEIGTALAQAGTEDRAFGIEGQINIFDMARKAGMMSDVGNMDPEQIKKAVKNVSRQVQAIMAIAGDPDVSRAIQRLAEMKKMGISGADANTTIQALGAAEAISGTSALKIQNTVGTQASYLFQQAGISGQGSMQAASSAYAGFANAQKMGLINPAMMAMMGGAEGATQSFLTGQIGLGRSLYNQIGLANRFMFGGAQSGVLGNLSAFGSGVANNPLAAMGALRMNAGVMTGAQLQENPLAPTQGIFDLMNTLPGQLTRGKDGKHRWDAFSALALSQGLSEDQVRSQLELMRAYSDPDSVGRMRMATSAKVREQYAAYLERQGIDYPEEGIIGGAMQAYRGAGLGYSRFRRGVATGFGALGEGVGGALDRATGSFFEYLMGDPTRGGQMDERGMVNLMRGGAAGTTRYDITDPNAGALSFMGKNEELIKRVENVINSGGATAEEYEAIMQMSAADRNDALQKKFGLSAREASQFARMGVTGKTMTGVALASGSEVNAAINAAFNYTRSGKGRRRFAQDLDKAGLHSEKMIALAVSTQMMKDPSSLKFLMGDESKLTAGDKKAKAMLAAFLGTSMDSQAMMDAFTNLDPNRMEAQFGKTSELLSGDENLRSLMEEAGVDFEGLRTKEGQERIAKAAVSRRNAMSRLGITSTSGSTIDDYQKLSEMEQGIVQQQAQFEKMASMGQLDFTGYMEATNANKMAISTDKFSRAVDVFVRAVEADTGEKISGQLSTPGG